MPKSAIAAALVASQLLIRQAQAQSQVVINEFVSNVEIGQKEWVEFYNSSSQEISLSGYTLEERTGTDLSGTSSHSLDSVKVPPNGWAIYELSSKLNNDGDILTLKNGGQTVDEISYGEASSSKVEAPQKGQSAGRKVDADSSWVIFTSSTKGSTNNSAQVFVPAPSPSEEPTITTSQTPKSPSPTPKTNLAASPKTLSTTPKKSVLGQKESIPIAKDPIKSPEPSPSPSPEVKNTKIGSTKVAQFAVGSGLVLIGISLSLYLQKKQKLAKDQKDEGNSD